MSIGQSLNPYGHIVFTEEDELDYKLEFSDHQFYIEYNNLILKGNHLLKVDSLLITTDKTCSQINTIIRIYNIDGQLKFTKRYFQIYYLEAMSDNQSVQFIDSGKRVQLDLIDFHDEYFNGAEPLSYNKGHLVIIDSHRNHVDFGKQKISLSSRVLDLKTDQDHNTYIFCDSSFYKLNTDHEPLEYNYQNGRFFQAKLIEGNVYWSEKKFVFDEMIFTLNTLKNASLFQLQEVEFDYLKKRKKIITKSNSNRFTNEPIPSPLKPDVDSFPFQIGNSNAQYQKYGNSEFVHLGVDIMGDIAEEVFAVKDGIVKDIIAFPGDLYCHIAIANGPGPDEQGYFYLHLEASSMPHSKGDEIKAGDYLGYLVEWDVFDFHHIHFARVKSFNNIWSCSYYYGLDNILTDLTNFVDNSAPVFEKLWEQNTIAFRSIINPTLILSPDSLYVNFDILCKAHDKSNSEWRVEVNTLRFELWQNLNDISPIYQQAAFNYDIDLPFKSLDETPIIVNTIYSTDGIWVSQGDYEHREFFQQISQSNGDGVIDEFDQNEYFDSTNFPDGAYTLRIYATDAVGNESFTDLAIKIANNPVSLASDHFSEQIKIFPNPANEFIYIESEIQIEAFRLVNMLGQTVKTGKVGLKHFQLPAEKHGEYLLELTFNDGKITTRSIIFN